MRRDALRPDPSYGLRRGAVVKVGDLSPGPEPRTVASWAASMARTHPLTTVSTVARQLRPGGGERLPVPPDIVRVRPKALVLG
jgi:hypothetical protein